MVLDFNAICVEMKKTFAPMAPMAEDAMNATMGIIVNAENPTTRNGLMNKNTMNNKIVSTKIVTGTIIN